MPRFLSLLAGLLTAAAVFSATPALAGAPAPAPYRPGGSDTVSTQHFEVWYDSNPDDSTAYITQTQATGLAAMAERAYAAETGWGYQAPVDDGDGKIDIYVIDFTPWPGVAAFAVPDAAAAPSSGSIDLARSIIGGDWELHTIAHELFHLIQFRSWVPSSFTDHWLLEGSAEWAGYKVDGYGQVEGSTGPPDLSLDCYDSIPGHSKCAADGYTNGGYSRWSFYEFLAQRYGNTFVNSAFAQANTTGSALSGLVAALGAKGATLTDTFADWTVRQMAGGYGITGLDGESALLTPAATFSTGAVSSVTNTTVTDLPAQHVSVDHLAARYVEFDRAGDGQGGPCYAAQLTITVTLPAGVASRPFFYWNGKGSTAAPLTVSGSTATTTVPWDTCRWTSNRGMLSLPNPTTNVDGADFTVSAHMTVDATTPATASPPPAPTTTPYVPITSVGSGSVVPSISLFGPLVLQLPSSAKKIQLVVQSGAEGVVSATLGAVSLGRKTVVPGTNSLVFNLPKGALRSVKAASVAPNLLVLTPLSSDRTASGVPVTVKLKIEPAKRAKKAAK